MSVQTRYEEAKAIYAKIGVDIYAKSYEKRRYESEAVENNPENVLRFQIQQNVKIIYTMRKDYILLEIKEKFSRYVW